MSPGKEIMKIINEKEVSIYGSEVPSVSRKKELIIIEGNHEINDWFEIKSENENEHYNISKLLKIPLSQIGNLSDYNSEKQNTYYINLPIDKFNKLQEHYYFRFLEKEMEVEEEKKNEQEDKLYLDQEYYTKLVESLIQRIDPYNKYISEESILSIEKSISGFNDIYIPIKQIVEIEKNITDRLLISTLKTYVNNLPYDPITINQIAINTLRAYRENEIIEEVFPNIEKSMEKFKELNKNDYKYQTEKVEVINNVDLDEKILVDDINSIEKLIQLKIEKTKTFKKPLTEIFELISDLNLDEKKLKTYINKFNSKNAKTKMYDIILDTLTNEQIEVFKMINNNEFEEIENIDREIDIVDDKLLLKNYREDKKTLFNKILLSLVEYRRELDNESN